MLDAPLVTSLFSSDIPEPAYWESRYPPRKLAPEAIVTRFGPSPTGFLHTGGIYVAMIAKDLSQHSRGSYFVRIEDTDIAREVSGARRQFARAFSYFSMHSDENDENCEYGPYEQSKRSLIYATYARDLLLRNKAYLCFCSREELAAMAAQQQKAKLTSGYYGQWARCRNLSSAEVRSRLELNQPYTVRFRSPDGEVGRVTYNDVIRGPIEQPDNRNDIVILKSSDQDLRLPTYHFAHAVDDHLMRVNLILRGEEWISSVSLHLQLFAALGFHPIPYAHIAPLMKLEGASRRKLSKRKDPEANVEFYMSSGYPAGAVLHYLRGLANSRIAEMTFEDAAAAPIRVSECGVAGPMFDLIKLESISKEYISHLPSNQALNALLSWADEYDSDWARILRASADITHRILESERNPAFVQRKDLAKWSDFRTKYGFLFAQLFTLAKTNDEHFMPLDHSIVSTLAKQFAANYEHVSDKDLWFNQVRVLASSCGFAASAGEFKKTPDRYHGSIRDVSNVIRLALTGKSDSPELFRVAYILGAEEVLRRVRALT